MMIEYLMYRWEWFLAQFLNFRNPIHIDIELNNDCNQKCISCWHSTPKQRKFKLSRMSLAQAKMILQYGRYLQAKSCKLNFRGEPTLYKQLLEVIYYAKYLGYVEVIINTNGVMPIGKFQAICEMADKVIVSLDSYNQDVYCMLHGCDMADYKKVTDCLSLTTYKHKVRINYHVNQYNHHEPRPTQYCGIKVIYRNTENREGQHISLASKDRKRKSRCPHMQRRLLFTATGKIYPCCVAYNEPEDIQIGYHDQNAVHFAKKKLKLLKEFYKAGSYSTSCRSCTSGDIWRK